MNPVISSPRRGFTLIELLVSLAVIGILASLFYPALNKIRQKAWDTSAHELCVQAATAWNQLLLTHRRFPSRDLIEWAADLDKDGDVEKVDGDMAFPMMTGTTCLLNWWKPTHPLPEFDLPNYKKWLKTAARGNKEVDFDDWDQIPDWPNDLVLERSVEQKKWGLVAPWANRWIKNAATPTTEGEGLQNVVTATVWVLLDLDGDGKVTLPGSLPGGVGLDSEGKSLIIPKSVVAWVFTGSKRDKVVTSW